MPYKCYYCNIENVTAAVLFLHMHLRHSDLISYTCGQDRCLREFQLFSCFKRHIIKKHPEVRMLQVNGQCYNEADLGIGNQLQPDLGIGNRLQPDLGIGNQLQPDLGVGNELQPDLGVGNQLQPDLGIGNQLQPENEVEEYHEPRVIVNVENITVNAEDLRTVFQNIVQKYFSRLYLNKAISRTTIQSVVGHSCELMASISALLENTVQPNPASENCLQMITHFLRDPFRGQSTDYTRTQFLQNAGYLILPKKIFLYQRLDQKCVNGRLESIPVEVTLSFIPLREVFKTFFENTDIYEMANLYLHSERDTDRIDDISHSPYWLEKKNLFFGDKFVIPLYVYYDEFECNNPLGSHAGVHKIGAVYLSLRCFPLEYQSRLSNIFMAMLFHYEDKVKAGNDIFQVLIDELIFLETTGISIVLGNGQTKIIYFALAMVIGDNAGLNSIMGYVGCSGNYFCRFCRGHKRELLNLAEEKESLLRTKDNYERDIAVDDYKLTGIKENSIWNQIPSFHAVDNYSVDLMHDGPEGRYNYVMVAIIYYLVYSFKIITLETINNRIQGFNYGYIEAANKPPIITHDMIVKKKKLSSKSAEMMCLVRNFGVMVGDLVPEGDTVWNLYISTCEIMDIEMAPFYYPRTDKLFSVLIAEHLQLYIDTCKKIWKSESNILKPKFHNLVHYPRIANMVGPLRNFWCMRYEAKHAQCKKTAVNSNSRINIVHTIAVRNQLDLAYNLLENTNMKPSLEIGPLDENCDITGHAVLESLRAYKWVKYNGHLYKADMCVIYIGAKEDELCFGFVKKIFASKEEVYFLYSEIDVIGLDVHKHSYVVDRKDLPVIETNCISLSELQIVVPLYLRQVSNTYYITMPYAP